MSLAVIRPLPSALADGEGTPFFIKNSFATKVNSENKVFADERLKPYFTFP